MSKIKCIFILNILGLVFSGVTFNVHAAGEVTDCSTFGYTGGTYLPGTFAAALQGGGEINFACSGTINVPKINIDTDTQINANGHDVNLTSGNTIISAVFWIYAKLDLNGLKFNGGIYNYGAIRNLGGNVSLTDCVISGNTTNPEMVASGVGIRNELTANIGTITLTRTTVSNNIAYSGVSNASAGGIFNYGNMVLTDSLVTGNSAKSENSTGSGGGIQNNGSMILNNSVVSDNIAEDTGGIVNSGEIILLNSRVLGNTSETGNGGGISGTAGKLTIKDSVVSGNSAAQRGGGIHTYGGTIIIDNSTISNNHSAKVGGGILNTVEASMEITNSTISDNTADDKGGGIYSFGGPVVITNSTLSGNSASQGGGIFNYASLSLSHVSFYGNSASEGSSLYVANSTISATQITNSLIFRGLTGNNCANGVKYITDGGYNLADDGSCNLTHSTSLTNINAELDPALADNGGITQTHALLTNSPAINRIPIGVSGCGDAITYDQRGVVRPQGYGCDIGSYELEMIKGDVNGDHDVNLTDALIVLQMLAGGQPLGLNMYADVNGDSKIGIAEVIYVLQVVAGLRAP